MPETYGLPEGPEFTRPEQVQRAVNEVIAGQGIVRRVVLYWLAIVSLVVGLFIPPALAVTASAIVLLMATDGGLA